MIFDDTNSQKNNPLAFLDNYEGFQKRREEADKQTIENFLPSLKAVHEKNMQPSNHAAALLGKVYQNNLEQHGLLKEERESIEKENKKIFLFNLMDKTEG